MAYFHTTVLDEQIKALPTVDTASGSVATFDTDKAENLINLEVAITATGGGGTPVSPIAINGFSACNLSVNGTTETIPFGQTVYGGRLNVGSGVLTVTHKCVQLTQAYVLSGAYLGSIIYNVSHTETSDANFTKAYICNRLQYVGKTLNNFTYGTCIAYSNSSFNLWIKNGAFADLAEATQWLNDNPTYICFELATATTIQLDSKQIQAIIGNNNIYADTGDIIDLKFVLSVGKAIS